jgi:hypothetical protein
LSDQRITQLPALPAASAAATDVLPVADVSASQTKKITVKDLVDAGLDLVDASSIDLSKLDQSSTTKIGATALATGAVTAAKLASDSSIAVDTTAPSSDNFEGRGYYNSSTGALQVFSGGAYANVSATIPDDSVTTAKLADGAVTTAKASNLGTAALANDAVTYAKIQNVSATDKLLGRSSSGSGDVEEINCTAAGRALLDDADDAAQRATLGLGTLATQSGTFSGTFSGTSSGTNTGDQTITLTGDVTGSGTGSFAATIASGAVVEAKLGTGAVTTGKVADDAITAAKLADQSAAVVAASTPSGSGAFIGQQWLNTNTGIEYTWDGTSWVRQASLGTISFSDSTPLSFSVAYPDNYSATITTTLDTQSAARVFAGPTTGSDAAPTFRALVPSDLPDATGSTKGIIQPGTGLSVTSGTLNHSNSATAGTYPKVTVDAQGHVTAGTTLADTDIPALPASKITSGTFNTALIADDAVTGQKLANYSTAKFGEALPTADFIGQIFFNPLDEAFFLWDGNVWQPLGISAGSVIFAGTYDATLNQIATVTTEGSAIGLTVGNALPSASSSNNGYYVVVSVGGTGTAPAPTVALAPPDLLLSNGSSWTVIDVSSTFVAQTANNVSFSPAANLGSTNVQAAIEEVSNECRNADNITSGTLLATKGGTGATSYTKGDLLAASSSTALSKLGVGTNGQVLRANSATATGLEWGADYVGTVTSVTGSGAISVSNGTTTPAVSVASASTSVAGVVQLSDSTGTTSSVLAATPTAVKAAYDLAAAAVPAAGGTFTGDLALGANVGLVFEGSTDDANETKLLAADPTADRLIYLPNADGTLVLSGAIVNADIASGAAISGSKIVAGTTSVVGVVQLTDSTSSTSTSTAATPNAVKSAYDLANAALPKAGGALTGDVTLNAQSDLRFADSDSSNWVAFQGPATVSSNVTWTLPSADGTSGQVLSTNGSGTLSWATAAAGATDKIEEGNTSAEVIDTGSDGRFVVTTEGTERLRVDSNGRVGIGATNPGSALNFGDTSAESGIQLGNGADFTIKRNVASLGAQFNVGGDLNNYQFHLYGSEVARIDSSGRLLVGTSSVADSSYKMQIGGHTDETVRTNTLALYGYQTNQASGSIINQIIFGPSLGSGAGGAKISQIKGSDNQSDSLCFFTGSTSLSERMRIGSDGGVFINTTNTDPTANRVNGIYIATDNAIRCRVSGSGAAWNLGSSASALTHINFYTDNGSSRVSAGSILSNGSTTTYNTSSDYRLKENIVCLSNASDRLKALKPVQFEWKKGFGGTQPLSEGFIAHELQEVCPLAVQGTKDEVDVDGNPVYQGIDQSKLVPLLTAALQEAIGRIETLEADVAALKGV